MQIVAVLKKRKIVIVVAFLVVALGVGYLSQYAIDITQYSKMEPSPYVSTAPEPLLGAVETSQQSSYDAGSPYTTSSGTSGEAVPAQTRMTERESLSLGRPVETPAVPDTALTFDRLVIFTAKTDVNVTSVRQAIQDLQGIAYALGGYVSDSYVNPIPAGSMTDRGILAKQAFDASVTLRIPSQNFNAVLNRYHHLAM